MSHICHIVCCSRSPVFFSIIGCRRDNFFLWHIPCSSRSHVFFSITISRCNNFFCTEPSCGESSIIWFNEVELCNSFDWLCLFKHLFQMQQYGTFRNRGSCDQRQLLHRFIEIFSTIFRFSPLVLHSHLILQPSKPLTASVVWKCSAKASMHGISVRHL